MYHLQNAMIGLLFPSPKWDALYHDLSPGCHDYVNTTYALMGRKLRVTLKKKLVGLKYDAWYDNSLKFSSWKRNKKSYPISRSRLRAYYLLSLTHSMFIMFFQVIRSWLWIGVDFGVRAMDQPRFNLLYVALTFCLYDHYFIILLVCM